MTGISDEISPLLPRIQHLPNATDEASILIWREVRNLFTNMISIVLSFALQNTVQAFNILQAGTLGPLELEVASYGFMFASCTGSMMALGGTTAIDILCGQAITSQSPSSKQLLAKYLQQTLLVLSVLFLVLITPLWMYSAQVFLLMKLDTGLALATGEFMRAMIIAGLTQVFAESIKKYLQVQGEGNAVGWATVAASTIGVCASYMLTQYSRLGLWSCPVAFTIYQLVNLSLLLGYTAYRPKVGGGERLQMTSLFNGLPTVVYYALTGILTVATEYWSFEIVALLAGRLQPAHIGAQSIIMSSDLILTTVALGLGVSISHRIGNLLGAGQGKLAMRAARAPYILSLIIGCVESVIIISIRHKYGFIFTGDESVVEATARVLPLMAVFQLLDLSNGGAGGVLRGAGKTYLCGLCNIFGYYGVGLTAGWWFCFRLEYGLFGLWAGVVVGSLVLLGLQTICIFTIAWDELASQVSHSEH